MISIAAKSSGDAEYTVDFEQIDGKVRISCDCQAGFYGKLCKHKTEFAAGHSTLLANKDDAPKLEQIREWISQTEFDETVRQITELETQSDHLKKKLSHAKKKLGDAMKTGLKASNEP